MDGQLAIKQSSEVFISYWHREGIELRMWIITIDHVENGKTMGWRSRGLMTASLPDLGTRFRLLCDDGEVCYEGVSDIDLHDRSLANEEKLFEPLECFGTPRFGCNRIQYLDREQWIEC